MGLRALNNPASDFEDPFASTGKDAVNPEPSTQGSQDCMPIYWTNATGTAIRESGKYWNDANASYLKVAVPYNGSNGGTSFSDVHADVPGASGSNHTLTVVGDSQTSTTTSKYYGSSGLFDGSGDYLTCAANTDWSLDGDFTIEGWMNIDSGQKGIICSVGDAHSTTGTDGFEFYAAGDNDFRVYGNATGGGSSLYWFGTGNGTFADAAWHHFALVRASNVAKAYINGTDIGKTYTTNTTYNGQLTLAAEHYDGGYDGHDGYLQDFRLYKGVAKYTSNFTIFPG